jgi:hypothetical protein
MELAGKPITCFLHREWHRPRMLWRDLPAQAFLTTLVIIFVTYVAS